MKHLIKLTAAVLSAGLLAGFATAAPADEPVSQAIDPGAPEVSMDYEIARPDTMSALIKGTCQWQNDSQVLITDSHNEQTIVNLYDETAIIDSATGDPLTREDIEEGAFVHVYTGIAMTMSLPPQANALAVICNIPEDFTAPIYHQVQSVSRSGETVSLMCGDTVLHISDDCDLATYLTRNLIYKDMIQPGAKVIAWYSFVAESYPAQAWPTKLLVLPYGYTGCFEIDAHDGAMYLNGEKMELSEVESVYKNSDGLTMVPLRAACEALGYSLEWDNDAQFVTAFAPDGSKAFRLTVGSEAVTVDGDMVYSIAPPELPVNRTFISVYDLELLTGAFVASKY